MINALNHFEKLGEDFFKKSLPIPLKNQKIIAFSKSACELIDLDSKTLKSKKFLDAISGKKPDKNFSYISQLYSGHQFGHYVEQLGDGRAVLLAQVTHSGKSWDLVLKGSGLTPFSRPYVQNADGKAVLRSSIREFLISESMFHLGIPTSRALCLIVSDDIAIRESVEPAAQIIRLAQSHVRFGTFETFFYRKQNEQIKILADYVMKQNFPEAKTYGEFLQAVVKSTAMMIAKWQAFGFCHGVMNTDNMSILGITFDYGPFGFLDEYNPNHICNHSDQGGRYSYANQPFIGFWNLNAFAITLSSLISMEEIKEILGNYEKIFSDEYHDLMAKKLGFPKCDEDVKKLIYEVLEHLEKNQLDYTIFFRNLSSAPVMRLGDTARGRIPNIVTPPHDRVWLKNWNQLLKSKNISDTARKKLMNQHNPKFILRNYLLQNTIKKAENGDFSEVKKLQKITKKPFHEQPQNEPYATFPPASAKEILISCSS
jgi:uncharacterized protein YdiU (UPF0061 family)